MFKLIFFLVGLGLAILFAALNLGNTSDISLLFAKLTEVPIFLSVSISFLLGAIFTLPFAFSISLGAKKQKTQNQKE